MRLPSSFRFLTSSFIHSHSFAAPQTVNHLRLSQQRMASSQASVVRSTSCISRAEAKGFCVQFGLKDPSLIKFQGFIDGKWVDAKDGETIVVNSEYALLPVRTAQVTDDIPYLQTPSTTKSWELSRKWD